MVDLRHLSVECGKQKQFRCAFCNNSYYYKRDLKMHAIRIHNIVAFVDYPQGKDMYYLSQNIC
nr:unnamed protein product [Callosobruchus analis]